MRWTTDHNRWLASLWLKGFQKSSSLSLLKNEDEVLRRISSILDQDFEREKELDREVSDKLDELEQTHGSSFDRQKMRSLLKGKLAEQKGIVL